MTRADAGIGQSYVVELGPSDVDHRSPHRKTLPLGGAALDPDVGQRPFGDGRGRSDRLLEIREAHQRVAESEFGTRGCPDRGQFGRRIVAELLGADPDHIERLEAMAAGDALAVDVGPVGREVDQHVAIGEPDDLRVAAGRVGRPDDDLRLGVAAEHEGRHRHLVLAAVGQAHESAGRLAQSGSRPRGAGKRNGRGRGTNRRDGPGDAGHDRVGHDDFMSGNPDSVTMEQWRWIGPDGSAIDRHHGARDGRPDDRMPARGQHDGMAGQQRIAGEAKRRTRLGTDNVFPGGHGDPLRAVDKLHRLAFLFERCGEQT